MGSLGRIGICRLTGVRGAFVKSHLIPQSLTRLPPTGQKAVETGIGLGVKRRPSSWYDETLVGRAGEDILARIDGDGIEQLRRARLVWSAMPDPEGAGPDDVIQDDGCAAYRVVEIENPQSVQLFYLSLLWRAAATTLSEFRQVQLPPEQIEGLRQRVHACDAGAFDDYPVQLFQILDLGVPHNRVPLLERKRIHRLADLSVWGDVSYVRFYFDGLAAHVHLPGDTVLEREYLRTCLQKAGPSLVFVHQYDESRTSANLRTALSVAAQQSREPPGRRTPVAQAIEEAWGIGPISTIRSR